MAPKVFVILCAPIGSVAERLNAPVLKTGVEKSIVSSNLTGPANYIFIYLIINVICLFVEIGVPFGMPIAHGALLVLLFVLSIAQRQKKRVPKTLVGERLQHSRVYGSSDASQSGAPWMTGMRLWIGTKKSLTRCNISITPRHNRA